MQPPAPTRQHESIAISGKIIVRSHPAGTIDKWKKLMHEGKTEEAKALLLRGKTEVEQKNLIVDSSSHGKDILVQYLISAYNGSNPFPLGIAWGEIGTGNTAPAAGDIALTTPTNRAPVSYACDFQLQTAQLQFFFPDGVLANAMYYEFGTFIGGSSSIGSGNMFNHALFSTPYSKSAGTDSTIELDATFS